MVKHSFEEWKDVDVSKLVDIKAQLNPDERMLLYWLGSKYYQGWGEIIDAGAFLGGSAICLAKGLKDSSIIPEINKIERIHSYDLFRYGKWIADKWIPSGERDQGQSILDIYHENISEYEKYIIPHVGDLCDKTWRGGVVEILFLDICKNPLVNDRVMELFFTELRPNESVIIHQDYCVTSFNIWIYASMEVLSDALKCVTYTRVNSVVYMPIRKITPIDIEKAKATLMTHEQRIEFARLAANRWPDNSLQKQRILESIDVYNEFRSRNAFIIRPVASSD